MNSKPMLTQQDLHSQIDQIATKFVNGDLGEFQYRPTGHEQVQASVADMKAIPPNANPFHHDDFNMGTDLVRGWVVMHPGFDNKEEPNAMEWLYLVNTRTGQRIRIDLNHVPTDEQKVEQEAKWREKYGSIGNSNDEE